jgi:hypothetical protein
MATVYANNYGFTAADGTRALQAAIDDPTASKIIVRNMGQPWLISKTIFMQSNKEIVFAPGAIVQAKPGAFADNTKPLIRAVGIENIKLTGQGQGANQATLKMNRETGNREENGHILGISGVKNYVVSGLKLTGAGNDGIYIDGAASTAFPTLRPASENGLIENIVADRNRRQGLSIISAQNLTVRNSKFINTSGTAPSSGIDFEPNVSTDRLQNIKIDTVDLRNNDGSGIDFALGNQNNSSLPISIDVNRVIMDGNHYSGVAVGATPSDGSNGNLPSATPNGTISIRNTIISNTKGDISFFGGPSAAISIQGLSGDRSDPRNLRFNFDNVTISGTGNGKFIKNPIYLQGFGGTDNAQQIGNVAFKNVVVRDNFKRDILRAQLGREDGYLSNISGNITAFNPNGVTTDYDPTTPPKNFSLTVVKGNPSKLAVDPLTGVVPVVNPNFSDRLNGWSVSDPSRVAVVQRSIGNNWVKVAAPGSGIGQDLVHDVITGQHYVVSGTAKMSKPGDEGYFGILFKDAANKIQSVQAIKVSGVVEQPLQLGFTAPSNFATAQAFVWKDPGVADLFVDDFSLVKRS